MNMILRTVTQEKQRIEYMLARYQDALEQLPRGTICKKAVGSRVYYYLKYRDGKKIVSQYIRKIELEAVQEQIQRRKHMEAMIKSLQEEKTIADKILEGVE